MHKTFIFIFGLIFLSNIVYSQLDEPMYLGKTSILGPGQSQIGMTGNYYISSNSLNGTFNNALLNGKYITDEDKNSVKLKGDNIFGSASNFSLTYSFRLSNDTIKNSPTSFILGVADKRYTNISFNDDYFNLLFYGNSNLPEANLDGFNFSLLTYQKLFAGISKKYSFNNYDLHIYGGLALLKGQKAYSLEINNGFVNTSEFGEEINVGLDYNYNSSDTTSFGLMDWNGTGVSTDFIISFFNKEKRRGANIGVYNFGTIFWNKESIYTKTDTSFSYNGQEVADFMDFSLNDFSELNEDSLLNDIYYDKSSNKSFNTRTPTQISINYFQFIVPIRTIISIGAKHLLYANMKVPYYYFRSSTIISSSFSGTIQLTNGGYGRFQVGLGCNYNYKQKFIVSLFSSNIQGFLHNENTYNQGAYVSVSYKF